MRLKGSTDGCQYFRICKPIKWVSLAQFCLPGHVFDILSYRFLLSSIWAAYLSVGLNTKKNVLNCVFFKIIKSWGQISRKIIILKHVKFNIHTVRGLWLHFTLWAEKLSILCLPAVVIGFCLLSRSPWHLYNVKFLLHRSGQKSFTATLNATTLPHMDVF